jgi:hypothetical protein
VTESLIAGRKALLEYLRSGFGHGKTFVGPPGEYSHTQVMEALQHLSKTDQVSWKLINKWITTRLDVKQLASKYSFSEHTLKRRLYSCADAILNIVRLESYKPVDTNPCCNCELFQEILLKELEYGSPLVVKNVKEQLEKHKKDSLKNRED